MYLANIFTDDMPIDIKQKLNKSYYNIDSLLHEPWTPFQLARSKIIIHVNSYRNLCQL